MIDFFGRARFTLGVRSVVPSHGCGPYRRAKRIDSSVTCKPYEVNVGNGLLVFIDRSVTRVGTIGLTFGQPFARPRAALMNRVTADVAMGRPSLIGDGVDG